MLIIGVIGGIASGKSLIAKQLAACGAHILDGDRAGHRVLEEDAVKEAIRLRWGEEVFTPDNQVDRGAVGRIVFAPTPQGALELAFLEALTHPRIKSLLHSEAQALAAQGVPAAVLDAAVMLKAGWDSFCDRILFVDAPRPLRLARARQRGWSDEEFERREAAQESMASKRQRADAVIDNSTTPEATQKQVEAFWRSAVEDAPAE